jgi:hypothetical protein
MISCNDFMQRRPHIHILEASAHQVLLPASPGRALLLALWVYVNPGHDPGVPGLALRTAATAGGANSARAKQAAP